MTLEAFSLRSSVFLVPAPERQMPALPPHTEAAAAPALTPGEQRVPDHRSSLWEAIPVAGAAALSSARMSPLISGTIIKRVSVVPRCLSPVPLMASMSFTPQAGRRGTWQGWGARFSLRIPSAGLSRVIDSSALPLTLLIAGSSFFLPPRWVSPVCFLHLSRTPAVTHPGLYF